MTDAPKINLRTTVFTDGDIETVMMTSGHEWESSVREVIRTKERHVRDALIALGWTPPMETP